MTQKPAIALVAVAGRRKQTLDVATQIEKRRLQRHLLSECRGLYWLV